VHAQAPADAASGSTAVARTWFPLVGHLGLQWRATPGLSLLANVDQSFRAPNLDDLTARQQTGPGFQFENPALAPERAITVELGARASAEWLDADVWLFQTHLAEAIARRPVGAEVCPPQTPQCQASWSRFQLVNAPELSYLRGVELALRGRLPASFYVRASAAWTFGEGPNLADPPSDPAVPFERRVPLSRVPPLNGTAEVRWQPRGGFGVGGALRWAGPQARLALADRADPRIPPGGTPGFAVVDLRASYRLKRQLLVGLVAENLFDAVYRYHGSSVNGPGRGLVGLVEYGPF
jgi:outer membrane receptor protein involved in Fe transport